MFEKKKSVLLFLLPGLCMLLIFYIIPFFIGIGCSALSMDAAHIPAMKECVRKLSAESCEDFARGLLRRRSTESIREAIDGYALTLLSSSTEKLAERTHSKST